MASKFELDLSRFMKKVKTNHSQVIGKIALDLATRIIVKTPTDEGRAKANWQVSINRPKGGTVENVTTGEPKSDARGSANAQLAINKAVLATAQLPEFPTVYIVSNLAYITALERGSSMQAGSGMVAVSIAEIQEIYR